jgi:hypothetical protein
VSVKKPGKGHASKHVHHRKHAGNHHKHHQKAQKQGPQGGFVHHVTAVARHPHHARPRGLAAATGDLACCAAEAVAASLRLAGWPAGDGDVMALYGMTEDATGAGATMLATLEAAAEYGVAGRKPKSFGLAPRLERGVILGLALPDGPHFVCDDGESWWSWGEAYCPCCEFPDAVIEEAWEVAW